MNISRTRHFFLCCYTRIFLLYFYINFNTILRCQTSATFSSLKMQKRRKRGKLRLKIIFFGIWLLIFGVITNYSVSTQNPYSKKALVRKKVKRVSKPAVAGTKRKHKRARNLGKKVAIFRSKDIPKRKTADCKKEVSAAKNTRTSNQPTTGDATNSSEIKRAGEFKGDLRDIPSGKPVKQYRPKLPEPKSHPKPYVKPTVIKPTF